MIKASAPGRAGIIGNPTDMYGGSVISCSIKERAYCHLGSSDRLRIRVEDEESVISCIGGLSPDGGKLDIIKAAIRAFKIDPSTAEFSINTWSEVPEQAGLAGSTVMLATVVGCLISYLEIELNKYELAETIRQIEAESLKVMCGYQDHYMAVFGGLNYIDFRGKEWMRPFSEEPFATVEPLADLVPEMPMILASTGIKHNSGALHKGLRERWLNNEKEVIQGYIRIAELGREGKKALLEQDWPTLGILMNENHSIQQRLGGSGEANDALIRRALDKGAYGAKLAGAGKGGTIIVLTDNVERMEKILLDSGVERTMSLSPVDGLIVERDARNEHIINS